MSIRGSTLLHDRYLPFLAEVDRRLGRKARVELEGVYSFLDAWIYGLTPTEAIAQALEDLEARLEVGHA